MFWKNTGLLDISNKKLMKSTTKLSDTPSKPVQKCRTSRGEVQFPSLKSFNVLKNEAAVPSSQGKVEESSKEASPRPLPAPRSS